MSVITANNTYAQLAPVRVVATTNQAGTYFNGTINNGVGATLTYTAAGALTIDSVALVLNDRVLLQGQTSAVQNGVYVVTNAGASGVSAILQRSGDMQCNEQIKAGQFVPVMAGSVEGGSIWVIVESVPAILGLNNLTVESGLAANLGTASAKAASDNTKATLASVNTPTILNHIAAYSDTNGTLTEDVATAINGGNLQAGLSGTAGTVASFPSGATSGSLVVAAVTNSSGNFNTTISNASAVAQAQVVSIPDGGAATSNFVLSKTTGTQHITVGSLQIDGGNLTAGISGTAGTITSFPATAANGSLILAAVNNAGGNFSTTISNAASVAQAQVVSIPDSGSATVNFILSKNAGTQSITTGSLSISAGNLTAGASGAAGTLTSFPAGATSGSLIFAAVTNASGNFNTTISNASAVGQSQVVSIPDGGSATSNFIISKSASTQHITSGNLQVDAGNLIAGISTGGVNAILQLFPTGATTGSLRLIAANNGGNFNVDLTNASFGQATVITIPDPGAATAKPLISGGALVSGNFPQNSGTAGLVVDSALAVNKLLTSTISTPDVGANLVTFDVTVGQAGLAAAGHVTLITSAGARQYKIRAMYLNSGGTNFSGGGGDRLGQVSDGTTVYSVVPAANMQALTNARWGDTALPFPASAAIFTSTAAGISLFFAYSGGTVDYTTGSLRISILAERVA